MGHVRLGFLPRTAQWNKIVSQLTLYDSDSSIVSKIADDTLSIIKKNYESMPFEDSIIKAISFLANLSLSAKKDDQIAYLNSQGFTIDEKFSTFSIISSVQKLIVTNIGSLEINKITKDSVMQAIISYQEKHNNNQVDLFGNTPENPLRSVGNGAAFCELARSFFATFTDKQIKYYIERVAASSIGNSGTLDKFITALSNQSLSIADHAFDTSKLIQSFAAGWFNKHVDNSVPSEKEITDFLRISFGKMREEFRREAEGK